jgi:hypothetical protein
MPSEGLIRLERSLTVASFLGGLTLSALTFLINVNMPEGTVFSSLMHSADYKKLLITVAGTAGSLLILSVFGLKRAIVLNIKEHEWFFKFASWSYESGYGVLLVLFPLIVLPFSDIGAYFIIVIEVIWGVMDLIDKWKRIHSNVKLDDFY